MLRHAAAPLRRTAAAWLQHTSSRLVSPAPRALLRQPDGYARCRPTAQCSPVAYAGARGYARMARRILPARPEEYSSSDGEVDDEQRAELAEGEEELEADADGEDAALGKDWEGFMLDFGSGDEEEEEEK